MTDHPSIRRLAIVTGASRARGIGAAICQSLAQAGLDIFFTHWSPYDQRMPWVAEEDEPANLQSHLITFLASEDAAWVTGQIIHSTGGF